MVQKVLPKSGSDQKDDKLSGVYTKKQVKGLLKSAYDAKSIDMSLCTNDILQDLLSPLPKRVLNRGQRVS